MISKNTCCDFFWNEVFKHSCIFWNRPFWARSIYIFCGLSHSKNALLCNPSCDHRSLVCGILESNLCRALVFLWSSTCQYYTSSIFHKSSLARDVVEQWCRSITCATGTILSSTSSLVWMVFDVGSLRSRAERRLETSEGARRKRLSRALLWLGQRFSCVFPVHFASRRYGQFSCLLWRLWRPWGCRFCCCCPETRSKP